MTPKQHDITERAAPDRVIVLCSCGWSHSETRRQNALARTAKLRAARAAHLAFVAPQTYRLRVTPALRQLLWSQIECRSDSTESAGISVYRKLRDAKRVAELNEAEAEELRQELDFWLMPEQEKYPGEERCARAARRQLTRES